ncbi:MAG: hypothetical protein ABF449_00635 [Ethanoligenens sp.]
MKKLTISTDKKRFSVSMEDTDCERFFDAMVVALIKAKPEIQKQFEKAVQNESKPQPPAQEPKKELPVQKDESENYQSRYNSPDCRLLSKPELPPQNQDPLKVGVVKNPARSASEIETAEQPEQYTGFLYIKCAHCGEEKGFCAKTPMRHFYCEKCGEFTEFAEKLKPLHVNCECGRYFKYLTNKTDAIFDMKCIECGNLVPVEYNRAKDIYETIQKKHHG